MSFSQRCGSYSPPSDIFQIWAKIDNFFQGRSDDATSNVLQIYPRLRCFHLKMVYKVCFQIEKRSCGSGVIAAQSLKSSILRLCGSCACDADVLRPQFCDYVHTTAWRASWYPISTSYAKKRRKFQRLPFLGTRQVHPKVSQKSHCGAGCDADVLRPQFYDYMHTLAWRASWYPISTSYAKKRRKFQRLPFLGTRQVHPTVSHSRWSGNRCLRAVLQVPFDEYCDCAHATFREAEQHVCWCVAIIIFAFRYVSMKIETRDMCDLACFCLPRKQMFEGSSAGAVWWILRLHARHFQRSWTACMLVCRDHNICFSLRFNEKISTQQQQQLRYCN